MAKKAKKRGVKPGTKRGPYKRTRRGRKIKPITLKEYAEIMLDKPNPLLQPIQDTPPQPKSNVGSTLSELSFAIDNLIMSVNVQTQRLKDML